MKYFIAGLILFCILLGGFTVLSHQYAHTTRHADKQYTDDGDLISYRVVFYRLQWWESLGLGFVLTIITIGVIYCVVSWKYDRNGR